MNIDNISIEQDGDIIFTTVAKYKLFLSYGKIGMDSYLLYSHLMFTARLQHTNTVKANNVYLRQGLHWTKERLRKAKNLLSELELIKQISRKDKETGKFTGHYIQVKTKTTPFEINNIITSDLSTGQVDNQTGGNVYTNALTNKQMLEQKKKYIYDITTFWNKQDLQTHKEEIVFKRLTKKHIDIINIYGVDVIYKAIENYNTIVNSDGYYFKHKWTLWDFISRGLDKFVDDASPFDNYKDRSKHAEPIETTEQQLERMRKEGII